MAKLTKKEVVTECQRLIGEVDRLLGETNPVLASRVKAALEDKIQEASDG